MEIKRGIAVCPGIAIGPALVLDTEGVRIPQRFIPAGRVDAEIQRLHDALAAAAADSREAQRLLTARLGPEYGAIMGAHALFFEDPTILAELDALIRKNRYSAEYAVSQALRRYIKTIESLGADCFLASKTSDLVDLERRVLRLLVGAEQEALDQLREPVVLLARDLTPSETARLDPSKVFAFATESGGRTSHTAIMAGAMELPAVVGVGKFVLDVSGGDIVVVDGYQGLLILDPDPATLRRYEELRESARKAAAPSPGLSHLPAVTLDGTRVTLLGNIEFPHETAHCAERGAEGVGLYRTEFLYVGTDSDPSEEEHFNAYMSVVEAVGTDRPVVIRTLDVGADKFPNLTWAQTSERNPFLGLRSIRLCLRNLTLFKTQMRAILRASAYGDVRILFPMISSLLELRQCKMILAEVKEDLEEQGIRFNPEVPVGTMIEVPSAALMADRLAREVDFFSVGTNDLVQYTLAADRNNENVASIYNPADPAVLRLLDTVSRAARRHGTQANVCGEMSGEPIYTLLLLGLGYRQFSAAPHTLPEVKRLIRLADRGDAERIAKHALQLETARDVTNFLREQKRRLLPDGPD